MPLWWCFGSADSVSEPEYEYESEIFEAMFVVDVVFSVVDCDSVTAVVVDDELDFGDAEDLDCGDGDDGDDVVLDEAASVDLVDVGEVEVVLVVLVEVGSDTYESL